MLKQVIIRSHIFVIRTYCDMALKGLTVNNIHNQCNSSCNPVQCWKWDISKFIYQRDLPTSYAVVMLNTPITQSQRFFNKFWNNANARVTVDGGTDKWEAYVKNLPQADQERMKSPELVTGDFDSISKGTLEKYREQTGCKVVHTPDQSSTDYTKALIELHTHCQQNNVNVDHVIAIAQSSRRMDQIFANVETMFHVKEKGLLGPETKVYLISDDAISWLLYPGDHLIEIPEESRKHPRAWCSLVPIGEPCLNVSSSGLKWDLDNHVLRFGELVSTSNTFTESSIVKVKCSHTLLWSMKVPSLIIDNCAYVEAAMYIGEGNYTMMRGGCAGAALPTVRRGHEITLDLLII